MIPIVTPAEMKAIDEAAPEPVEVLIERAGAAVARSAIDALGGTYGRRVVVVAGKGNNGADGRAAARRLARRGVRVTVIDAAAVPKVLPRADLVIDAAYGTGFRGEYAEPDPGDALVLAVDVPSGDVRADLTVTFAALKPSLLFGDTAARAGLVEVVDIGLDVSSARAHVVEGDDIDLPVRPVDAHKYLAAVLVVAGSPGMGGAAALTSGAAMRSGSGYVRLATPGAEPMSGTEVVGRPLPAIDWAHAALAEVDRMKAVAIGPGLGRDERTVEQVRRFLGRVDVPTVVDGDGLAGVERGRGHVLTPHEGEYERLTGSPPGDDRLASVRAAAAELGSVVLLKGPTSVAADPRGRALVSTTGGPWLATAGTGDVLTGIVAAFLARGVAPLEAAAWGVWVHGSASRRGPREGLVASDLIDRIPQVLGG